MLLLVIENGFKVLQKRGGKCCVVEGGGVCSFIGERNLESLASVSNSGKRNMCHLVKSLSERQGTQDLTL